jgi:hypothetical protein
MLELVSVGNNPAEGYNFRLNNKIHKNPDGLAGVIKEELEKSSNKALTVDSGVYEKKHHRNYERLKKRRMKQARKLERKEITPIQYMKNVGRSVLHLDPKLAALVEEAAFEDH